MFRMHRWIGIFAVLCACAFIAEVGLAQARTESAGVDPSPVYREGPLGAAPPSLPELPRGAEELLGLSVLAAILYGLRVADLGRDSRSS